MADRLNSQPPPPLPYENVDNTQFCSEQQNTAYGEFIQTCLAQHKRQYPDELIHKKIEEFYKQCSFSWVNLSEPEQESFQEMADQSPPPHANVDTAQYAKFQKNVQFR